MKVLRRIPPRPWAVHLPVAAMGIFDGVHRGHQAILAQAVRRARAIGGTAVGITFYPHPLTVLAPDLVPPLLLTLAQRLKAFQGCGIQAALVIPFTQALSLLSPEEFVREVLVRRLRVKEVVVGYDFGFGAGRSGKVSTLRSLGRRFGFKVHIVGPVRIQGERVASHRIRDLIRQGKLEKAARFLGRPPEVVGQVVLGADRGKRLGFPTANLKIEAGVLPLRGVYAVRGRVGRKVYPGMANVGFRPTFEEHQASGIRRQELLEVHLFGWKGSLYGSRLTVVFLKRLRAERRFPSAQALARALRQDARRAQRALSSLQQRRKVI